MNNPLQQDLEHVLAHTEGLWEELRGNRIFITGGTGFFGCWLLESFAWANQKLGLNAQAVVLSRNPQAFARKAPHLFADKAIRFETGDVRDFTFPSGAFTHIVHAATEASVLLNEENPLLMLDTIIEGTRHTLDFAVACGAKKLLFTSSGAVYGKQPDDVTHIPEEYAGAPDPLNSRSAYGEGKRMAELLCAIYHRQHGLEVKVARCFAFLGPYLPLDAHFAVGNFVRDALKGGPVVMKSGGRAQRSYLYGADLAVWLWTLLFRGQPDRPYNVGSDQPITIKALAGVIAAMGGTTVFMADNNDRAAESVYVPDVRRARNELGLNVEVSLEEGLRCMLKWNRECDDDNK